MTSIVGEDTRTLSPPQAGASDDHEERGQNLSEILTRLSLWTTRRRFLLMAQLESRSRQERARITNNESIQPITVRDALIVEDSQ